MLNHKNWKLEYTITLLVVLGVILFFVPVSFESTRQANFISKWNEMYNRVDYMFQVINAHITDDVIKNFDKAENSQERERILMQLVKPYLRVDLDKMVSKRYKPKFMNRSKVYKGQAYYFDEFYSAEQGKIIGIKDIPSPKNSAKEPNFLLMIDINGILPPNTWGKDIYGINIYENGVIEPFGKGLSMDALKQDCSDAGTGVNCSYYYIIGGGFDE